LATKAQKVSIQVDSQGACMNSKYLYTIKWTQPYSMTNPFLQNLWNTYEDVVERRLEQGEFKEADEIIKRIQNASKSR
jgi:hypothetical protein